jgi:DNA repair protein RAD50
MQALKDHAKTIARLQKDLDTLQQEVGSLERQLSSTGSTKTVNDVQSELETLGTKL